jgi:HNH endonuclease
MMPVSLPETISLSVIDHFGPRPFSTADFINRLTAVSSSDWTALENEYGAGGLGGGTRFSARNRVAQILDGFSQRRILEKLEDRQAPPGWGASSIQYWRKSIDVDPFNDIDHDIEEIRNDPNRSATEKGALIDARRGQGKFRAEVRERWQQACAVTGCRQNEVLRASHIKAWRASTDKERLNPANGLFLCANLDALFDRGLISFEDNGEMIVSPIVTSTERTRLGIPAKIRLPLSDEERMFLNFHRSAAQESGLL